MKFNRIFPQLLVSVVGASALGLQANTTLTNGITKNATLFGLQTFDIIIVGGGTAGLIAAARLSEVPSLKVGVIEAGDAKRDDPNIDYIINYGAALGNSSYDWSYKSVPQTNLGGRSVQQSTGKVLGGSSAICDVLWQRASSMEYDVWGSKFGNGDSWSFQGLLPYFRKAEAWSQPPVQLPGGQFSVDLLESHNWDGPVHVGYNNYFPDPIFPAVEAGNKLGVKTNDNPDSGNSTGFLTPARAVDPQTGNRSYTLNSYLDPILHRNNLLVLTGGQVTKVLFASKHRRNGGDLVATGVAFVSENQTYTVKAAKEIILAAGSFKTPQLLELSGIGNKTFLQEMNIETIVDLPGVGENLIDQTAILMDYKVVDGVKTLDQLRLNETFRQTQAEQFSESRTGVMTYDTAALANVALKSVFSDSEIVTLSASLESYANSTSTTEMQKTQYEILRTILLQGENAGMEFLVYAGGGYASDPVGNASYITPFAFHLHPMSRGSVHINSSDPSAGPLIDPRYFESPFDVLVSSMAASWIRKWMNTSPISDLLVGPNSPPADIQIYQDFESYVRQALISTSHPIGTASMAPRSWGGVVDPSLLVYGTVNLRIIDASIQPMTIGVAPLATVYAIAEKASDIIKASIKP